MCFFLTEDEGENDGEKDEEKEDSSKEGDAIKEDIGDDAEENVQGRSIFFFGLKLVISNDISLMIS